MYLAAAGIGKLVLSDYDVVETSNLQRQIIHNNSSVGENKVDSGRQTVKALNPDCEVDVIGPPSMFSFAVLRVTLAKTLLVSF